MADYCQVKFHLRLDSMIAHETSTGLTTKEKW